MYKLCMLLLGIIRKDGSLSVGKISSGLHVYSVKIVE